MTAPESLPLLPYDAVFRIEVSLSSQTTSAIVMRTTARLYCLEGGHGNRPSTGDAEWRSLAYGAPCIQLLGQDNGNIFCIRIVIAEVESGISLWEAVVDGNSRYEAMQSNFHTFASGGNTYAIQFISEEEASRMLESMQDLLSQQQQQLVGTAPADPSLQPVVFKKPAKPPRRLSKKDISSPCNFKHVSGITMQRTSSCEQELSGTIQRKMRSLSLSNLSRHKTEEEEPMAEEKILRRKPSKRGKSLRRMSSKDSPDHVISASMKRAIPNRMSLPSHFHPRERQPITRASFLPPSLAAHKPHSHLNRHISQSSGDITAAQTTTPLQETTPLISEAGSAIQRRHTVKECSPSHRPVNYYCQTKATPTAMTHSSLSDVTLNRPLYQPVHTPVHTPVHEPVHEPRGQVQHVAIASSDILGWTPDGRLIVQIPQSGRGERVGGGDRVGGGERVGGEERGRHVGHPVPIRRASTGQFATNPLPKERTFGSSDALSLPPPNAAPPPFSTNKLPASEKPWNRPLPPTPLDIAMPQSQALRNKPHPHPALSSNKPHPHPAASSNKPHPHPAASSNKPHPHPAASSNKPHPHPAASSNKPHPHPAASSNKPVKDRAALSGVTQPVANGIPDSVYNSSMKQQLPSVQGGHTSCTPAGVETQTPPSSVHVRTDSVDTTYTMEDVTDQMSRALAQFDELLGVTQTSL